MIVQNNPTPLVVFALIAMVICGILGAMLGLNPFGPSQDVRDELARTQLAVDVRGTENAMSAIETPQAIYAQQTANIAQLTAIPIQQAATQVAGLGAVQNAQIYATQTAIAGDAMNKQLADQATQTTLAWNQQMDGLSAGATATAMAQGQVREQVTGIASFAVVGVGALTLFVWIIVHAFAQAIHARAEEKMAQAQFLAEQRRMVSLRASLQNHNGHKPAHPVPNSLMQNMGDVDKLPKAE